MRTRRFGKLGAVVALIIVVAIGGIAARGQKGTLAHADRLYAEKSYGAALALYEKLLKAGEVPQARRDDVQYRIAVSLGKSQKWDRALQTSIDFAHSHRGTAWEPRGLYWLGRLYLAVPHNGYRVGKVLHRGQNVPKAEGGEQPQYVDVSERDAQNARDALEAARVLWRTANVQDIRDQIQLNFDLSRVLSSDPRYYKWLSDPAKWTPPNDPSWTFEPGQTYSPGWPGPKKQLFLFDQIRRLDPGYHNDALSLFAEAVWLKGYHQTMKSYAYKYENDKAIPIPYPYQAHKAEGILRTLIRRFPTDPVRDQGQLLLGAYLQQENEFLGAIAQYQMLISQRPKSKWVADAKAAIEQIRRRQLSLNGMTQPVPGRAATVSVSYRNVNRIRFKLYRVKLEELVTRDVRLKDPQPQINQFSYLFGGLKRAERFYGPLVKEWARSVKDEGIHLPHAESFELPEKRTGAYVLEASVPSVRVATIVLNTDLVLIQKMHRDGVLFFASDAKTGAPRKSSLIVKQWWQEGNVHRVAYQRAATNLQGLASVKLLRKPGRDNFQVSAMAWSAPNTSTPQHLNASYALTNPCGWYYGYGENAGTFRVYSSTDRSVYRPLQTVHYREILLRRQGGDLKPLVKRKVHIAVTNPKGQTVHQRDAFSSEFGTVNGKFDLPEGAPLGEYTVQCTVPNDNLYQNDSGANRFRVEEYKKPEFEVTVTPEATRVRLGQPASAKVSAKYYFGGPVPNAKVTYRIHRTDYAQQYRFQRPFDFLWRYWGEGDYDTSFRNGPVVKQGEARTDDKGEATITFDTVSPSPAARERGPGGEGPDQAYTVEADVQDASRRTITGSGMVKATKHDVAVFLDYPHGYALQGDRVDVEVMTLNSSDQPVSVSGAAKVFRQPETPNGKEKLIYEEPLKTDEHGRAYFRWKTNTSGYFRVAFVTKDKEAAPPLAGGVRGGRVATRGEDVVEGSVALWVEGPELSRGRFHHEGVFLAVKEPYYTEGQTAKVLLVTPEPGCTVLLSREANNEIIDKRLVRVPGRSLELSVPLKRRDVPNVYLQAVMVRHGEMFTAQQELFVPPARQFSTLTVQADKERYQPGERATFRLAAKDWQGRPLCTELSVSVSDAALSYIQKDYNPDIRAYFYGDRRSISTEVAASPYVGFDQIVDDSQPVNNRSSNVWEMPEGMGMLEEWPSQRAQGQRAMGLGGGLYTDAEGRPEMPVAAPGAPPVLSTTRPARVSIGYNAKMPLSGRYAQDYDESASRHRNGFLFKDEVALNYATGDLMANVREELAAAKLRNRFVDTAFWTPAVVTKPDGTATVHVTWPDNLTQWRAQSVGISRTAQVGAGDTKVTTKKDLLVRLQAPRFFVERDEVTLSANVQNYLPDDAKVKVQLELGGEGAEVVAALTPQPPLPKLGERGSKIVAAVRSPLSRSVGEGPGGRAGGLGVVWIDMPKDGEKRVDWTLKIKKEGALRVRMTAQCDKAADAMEMTVPILVHGVERMTAQSGMLKQQRSATATIELPAARKPGSSELVMQLNPSLATVMLDALPYLADYPYGCIEQTMSRFMPAVVVEKSLKDLGYNLTDLRKRAVTLAKQMQNAKFKVQNANSPYTYPKGTPGTLKLPIVQTDFPRIYNPVFSERRMRSMVRAGLARIREMQHPDGGWGWWKDDSSDPYMTAYVVYGLLMAKQAGVNVADDMLTQGQDYLRTQLAKETDLHRIAYEARVLAMDPQYQDVVRPLVTGKLFQRRERLGAYSKALLALALHEIGDKEKAGVLLRNLESTAKVDEANGTANWDDYDSYWWHWYNDKAETNATVLQAYLRINPSAKLAPMVMKWLVNNRRGDAWQSTKETAIAVLAMADYARVNKELAPDYTLTVDLGGRAQRKYTINHQNALFFDNQFIVPDALLQTGSQPLTVTKSGNGTLYWSAYTRYFSLEEPIKATGNEVFVTRKYYRLLPGTAKGAPEAKPLPEDRPNPFLTGRYELLDEGGEWTAAPATEGGPQYDRVPLKEGETVTSGDQIEVELQLESKNDYDYVIFEDLKPAGCEPVELRSGGKYTPGLCSNMELRDQKVVFFLSSLPQGTRTLTYRLRAETPGRFHVLSTNGYAMYAPDVRTLSDETSLGVKDEEK